jgi:fatty-acyl-CoA synthase
MTIEESRAKPGAIGKPLLFTEARLEGEDGTEVTIGDVGELLLRGPHVCRGYWNNPEATAAALDAEGWFHTGDLARRDADGFFYIAGRKKDMIISGGVNVYPAEIEAELLLHPRVRDAAVVGIPHPTWGEVGIAFVVPGDEPPAVEEIAAFLEGRLARYKVPREFVFVDILPRTPYGKVVKGELRERYLSREPSREIP